MPSEPPEVTAADCKLSRYLPDDLHEAFTGREDGDMDLYSWQVWTRPWHFPPQIQAPLSRL